MVPLVGLQCVIVVFPDHIHLLFGNSLLRIQDGPRQAPETST